MIGAMDLDGNPRIQNAVVDMGAYESSHWGMASDVDGDRITDYDEVCVAGTEPTNAASCLQVDSSSTVTDSGGVIISWASRADRLYNVYRTTNLLDGEQVLVFPDVIGLAGFTVVTDAMAVAEGQAFYRVAVKAPAD